MSLLEHQDLLEKLLDTVKCPVCFIVLQPSVSQCVNGHGICSECRPKLNVCPNCREQFSPFKNTLLNQVLELFPHECKFKDCREFVKSMDDHEKWCGFRPTKCRVCEWNGCGKDILDHVKKEHPSLVIIGEINENQFLRNFDPDKQNFSIYTPTYAHGQFFWLNITNNATEQLFTKTFWLVPNGKIDSNIQVKFVLKNHKNMYIASTTMTKDSLVNPGKKDNSFSLHSSTLQDFINTEKKFIYSLYVTKVKSNFE